MSNELKPWMVEAIHFDTSASTTTQYETEAEANQAAAEEAQKDGVDCVHIHKWIRLRGEWQFVRTVQ